MSYTATARSIDGTLLHEIDVNGRHTITTDEPKTLGGTDTAPSPHELLAAMLASCVSTMIVLYAQRREWDLGDFRVDVDYDADTTVECESSLERAADGAGVGYSPESLCLIGGQVVARWMLSSARLGNAS
jgi:organic hydroperoxide reductase OsmC/OhrA